MNDRALLELAAKAAGYDVRYVSDGDGGGSFFMEPSGLWWGPNIDDGDTLRLACDLGLSIYPVSRTSSGEACSAVGSSTHGRLSEVTGSVFDTRAAVRRAVLLAAAEIGKSMA